MAQFCTFLDIFDFDTATVNMVGLLKVLELLTFDSLPIVSY